MTEMKIDSQEFVSDERIGEYVDRDSEMEADLRDIADEVLRKAAKAWGVTGRRVEGCVDEGNERFGPHIERKILLAEVRGLETRHDALGRRELAKNLRAQADALKGDS